jgi:biopolymer transport protein ExbD
MRAYRKRVWSALTVNMTPLIDVVFLIIIFFIIMINFSEMHIRNVNLPKADEAKKSRVDRKLLIPITIKSEEIIFLGRERLGVGMLTDKLAGRYADPYNITIQIRADENVPYDVIKKVLLELARVQISRIEFSTWKEQPEPLK